MVVGTGTEVGKTWVAARRIAALRNKGLTVAARKPVQSFESGDDCTDAHVLAAATGEAAEEVCPLHRWLPVPMAPPMAVEVLGRDPFTVADLVHELQFPDGIDVGMVETVGGLRSPIAADGDSLDLANALKADAVMLVAHAGLGTINDVRLAAALIAPGEVVLNRFDPQNELHVRNRDWLVTRDKLRVSTEEEGRW